MAGGDERWVEVSDSEFAHEREGLAMVRRMLPDKSPFRAWSNFEFRDSRGGWHEVDLLLLTPAGFQLVELKYYSGTIFGNDLTWRRSSGRVEDSPLKLARRKAQRFASKLKDEFEAWKREKKVYNAPPAREVVPFVKASVFLHHPDVRVLLPADAQRDLYGIDGLEPRTGLPGISKLVYRTAGESVNVVHEPTLVELLSRIGLVQRRELEVANWIIDGEAVDSGDDWQDFPARHRLAQERLARIRFRTLKPGAAVSERRNQHKLAEHEYSVTSRLAHAGVLGPIDFVDAELGVGLVYPFDESERALDLWLTEQTGKVRIDQQLSIIRQTGDALAYAHQNRLVHRGLSPRAVMVVDRAGNLRVQVGDWQTIGSTGENTSSAPDGVTSLFLADAPSDGAREPDRWLHEAFSAPEGAFDPAANRVKVDVFGLGALAFYVLSGTPPARTRAELQERLRTQNGLDVSIERPEVSPAMREAILQATRPSPSERTANVADFLNQLEARTVVDDDIVDPLEAPLGSVLGGRFRLERRLGKGSTAVGLLVTDLADPDGANEVVLKVALDDAAARRLVDEAEVLRTLTSRRVVRIEEGPIDIDGRRALVLSNAGRRTLADALRELEATRLSLDRLERWGIDVLESVVAIDKAGVDHRDIKPSNLGVSGKTPNKAEHLVLFDFSLTRAAASATQAGTAPYLDPFLQGRGRFDSAAERYSAAVVLYEMATGHTPIYGDGLTDPASISAEATINPAEFDPNAGAALAEFFSRALARDADRRHDTATEMLAAWRACFPKSLTTVADDADDLAAAAAVTTTLVNSGLSPRALSAVEQFGVATVGDLAAVDPALLNAMRGSSIATRAEVKRRAAQWRKKFGPQHRTAGIPSPTGQLDPFQVADRLLDVARASRGAGPELVALILGLLPDRVTNAFATQAQLGATLPTPVTPGRISQIMIKLQTDWAENKHTKDLLEHLHGLVTSRMTELGGVATSDELSRHLLASLAPKDSDDASEIRLAEGLLRLALERDRAIVLGGGEEPGWATRRREGHPMLFATDPVFLDIAEALGHAADRLIDGVTTGTDASMVIAPARAAGLLTAAVGGVLDTATTQSNDSADQPNTAALRAPTRLVALAGAMSRGCGVSAAGELHALTLPSARALALALPAVVPGQLLTPDEIRDRVRSRFPSAAGLPRRPGLDQVVEDAGIGLVFDEAQRAYRPTLAQSDTTGLETRQPTILATDVSPGISATTARLRESLAKHSFLALGIGALDLERGIKALGSIFHADLIDLSQILIQELRQQAEAAKLSWEMVLDADAQPAASKPGRGLRALVERSLPAVTAAIQAGLDGSDPSRPLVLTEPGLLARFGHLSLLAHWADLATPRPRALWVVTPQLYANSGPVVDGRPLPLASPGQFHRLEHHWIQAHHALEGSHT